MNRMLDQSQFWSTIGHRKPFSYWREVVCEAFTKLSPEPNSEAPFSGEIQLSRCNGFGSIAQITAGPQLVKRLDSDIQERPSDSVFVAFQITGESKVRQLGIEASLRPGDFVMLDARQPYDMQFDNYFRQFCLHLPIATVTEYGLDPAAAVARAIPGDQCHAAALLDSVSSLVNCDEIVDDNNHILHLLQLCYQGDKIKPLADQHLQYIQRYVARNCSEPDMTPSVVASHFRISVRYLHKLFSRSGVSFGRFLMRCRLRKSRMDVLIQIERPIFDIALDYGFKSTSHFSRAFSREFGMPPTAMRSLA